MSLVDSVLKRPYTVVAVLILVCLLGAGAGAVAGGFVTPFLLPSPTDHETALFGYDTILVSGTILLSHRRRWPALIILLISLLRRSFNSLTVGVTSDWLTAVAFSSGSFPGPVSGPKAMTALLRRDAARLDTSVRLAPRRLIAQSVFGANI